jgi:hypothetical protein
MWSRADTCDRCWGQGYVERWETVPWDELPEWQIAELMVNGGEVVRKIREPCSCSTSTK